VKETTKRGAGRKSLQGVAASGRAGSGRPRLKVLRESAQWQGELSGRQKKATSLIAVKKKGQDCLESWLEKGNREPSDRNYPRRNGKRGSGKKM